jgi:hypothetical protein
VVQSLLDPERKITLDEGNRELQAKLRAQHEEREKDPAAPLPHRAPAQDPRSRGATTTSRHRPSRARERSSPPSRSSARSSTGRSSSPPGS